MKVNGTKYPSQADAAAAISAIYAKALAAREALTPRCDPRIVESCAVCGIGDHAASLASRRTR